MIHSCCTSRNAYNDDLNNSEQIQIALLLELQAFSRTVVAAQAISNTEKKQYWWNNFGKSILSQASTVTGSVKDIIGDEYRFVKDGLTLFKEVIDIFKEND